MSDFFRFPTTPHLAWLAKDGMPRDDKVMSPAEARELLSGDVVAEEKIDGANLGLSLASDGILRAQNRGQYLAEPHSKQFNRLPAWLAQHEDRLRSILRPGLILFGEWCAARHSLGYDALPDWFLLFDVYDRGSGKFWGTDRRNILAEQSGLVTTPIIYKGRTDLSTLKGLVMEARSYYRAGLPLEGIVVKKQDGGWCESRAKLVRPDFTQTINGHWRGRSIEWNRVVT